jgi:hypothetical protein
MLFLHRFLSLVALLSVSVASKSRQPPLTVPACSSSTAAGHVAVTPRLRSSEARSVAPQNWARAILRGGGGGRHGSSPSSSTTSKTGREDGPLRVFCNTIREARRHLAAAAAARSASIFLMFPVDTIKVRCFLVLAPL